MSEEWKEGLCGCLNNIPTCVTGLFCPCYLYGKNQEKLEGDSCCSQCVLFALCRPFICLCHGPNRRRLRERYGLKEDCNDYIATWCCSPCAVCQEAREMEVRGPPPSQGM